jgi:hypothetical protein
VSEGTSFGSHSERRWRTKANLVSCRLCWKSITVDHDALESSGPGAPVYFRCPHCGGSFPVRKTDMAPEQEEKKESNREDELVG